MKRLLAVAMIVVAVAGLVYGVFFWYVYIFANRWPSQEKMVRSGYPLIPEAKQIDDLLGPARHQTSNYKEPDIVEWQTMALFAGRYELTMLVHVEVDRQSGHVLKVMEKPQFVLAGISSVDMESEGRFSISYGQSHQFGLAEWQKVVAAKGDFSVIGIHLKQNSPVANFDKYRAHPSNGIQMATESGKSKR